MPQSENNDRGLAAGKPLLLRGFEIYKTALDAKAQEAMLSDLRDVVRAAPLFSPMTPYGKPMSVQMTSAGKYGWVSDTRGYRYAPRHPNGAPWPDIPASVMAVWNALSKTARAPDCCLMNFYGEGARMGLHQDRDEANFAHPVVSISLGNEGLFRIGNAARGGKTESIWLQSGDVVVMGGAARLTYHGVDRIKFAPSPLMPKGGRINLTLRVVD
ncbi:MAG: alpha-ketoglutarate-dependent dioxygenase AlkB family protein [Paracoccaceae bacterium]